VATGDFVGRGIWTFEPDGEYVRIAYDWKIEAEKPLVAPGYYATMGFGVPAGIGAQVATGERSLILELARRYATTDIERAAVPPPPPTTFAWLLPRRGKPS
jgi:hypothetical protein